MGKPGSRVGFTDQDCRDRYDAGAARFLKYAKSELGDLIQVPENAFDRLVCMAAALDRAGNTLVSPYPSQPAGSGACLLGTRAPLCIVRSGG